MRSRANDSAWRSIAFADALRVEIAAAWRIDVRMLTERATKDTPMRALCVGQADHRDWLAFACAQGWSLLEPRSPRWAMQRWGEFRRGMAADWWVRHVEVWLTNQQRNNHPGLVVTDVRMPGQDGLNFARDLLAETPREGTLAFQVDLWSAKGPLPQNLLDVDERRKDIVYSSRTRLVTDTAGYIQHLRHALMKAIDKIPAELQNDPEVQKLKELSCSKVYNTVQLIYRDKQYETHSKDYEFSILNMREHWQQGLTDIRETLKHPEWLARPSGGRAVVTHDVHRVEG